MTTKIKTAAGWVWRDECAGKRGGKTIMWAPATEAQTQPSPWAIWSHRLRDVSAGDVVIARDAQ
jgi:hypothetical protein